MLGPFLIKISICLSSYRFMDMFPDTAMVRESQQELDDIIRQGVRNITLLIRATDSSITAPPGSRHGQKGAISGSARAANVTDVTNKTNKRAERGPVEELMDSSLACRLVREGLLTPLLLRQLEKEWSKNKKQEVPNQSALPVVKNKRKK